MLYHVLVSIFLKACKLIEQTQGFVAFSHFVCLFSQAKFKAVMIVGSYHLSAQESNLITLGNAGLWREVRGLQGLRHNRYC